MRPALMALFVGLILFSGIFLAATVHGGSSVTDLLGVTGGGSVITISSVSINNNPATITLTANTTTSVNVTATVSDTGGCSNVAGGTTTILLYRSGITSSTCLSSANPLYCYVATAFTASSTCSGGSQNTTTTFAVQYYAQATDSSSSFPNQNWIGTVFFTDAIHSTSSGDSTGASTTNDIATLIALNVPTSSVNYGTLIASSTTGNVNQLLNVENAGNASTTIQVQGTALTSGGNSIATSSQHYATSSFTFGGGEAQLSAAATTITGINTAPVFNFPIGGAGWQNTKALPYTLEFSGSFAYNNYLYSIGGYANGSDTSTVLFAPINATGSIGAWTSTQALPYTDYEHVSVVYNGYAYNIGGVTIAGETSTVLFAPINATGSIGAWTSTQALPYTNEQHVSVAYNGYIYTIGGLANGGFTSTVSFAPINATGSIGAWTSTQALPYTDYRTTSVAYNGYLYVIGGFVNGAAVTSTVLFARINATGSIGAWSSTQAIPYGNYSLSSLAYNGYLYVLGGLANGSDTSTVLFAPVNATGSIGAWSSTQALPYTDEQHVSVAYNGYVYTIGGSANSAITSTVAFAPLNARSTYWGLTVPNATPTGTYTGTNTFTAVFSP